MAMSGYPHRIPRRPTRPAAEWDADARKVLLAMLDKEFAVTVSEIEARASDRTWDSSICPWPINPAHFTNARSTLRHEGVIEATSAPSKGTSREIVTWSRVPTYGLKTKIAEAAQRKRAMTARHYGWAQRGGRGLGLIGRAGENALATALADPLCPLQPGGSTREILDHELLGEIDNYGAMVDHTNAARPVVITVLFEVKNTRAHYYQRAPAVLRFLAKAADLQDARPNELIFPVFVCRHWQYTLWVEGKEHGFLPARVGQQLVLPDKDLDQGRLDEVAQVLGFQDLVLGDHPTNQHLGIVTKALTKYARERAELWQENYWRYIAVMDDLPADNDDLPQ